MKGYEYPLLRYISSPIEALALKHKREEETETEIIDGKDQHFAVEPAKLKAKKSV